MDYFITCYLLISAWGLLGLVSAESYQNTNTSNFKECEFDGRIFKHNEKFEMDCAGWCHCRNGNIGCVSRCPPFQIQDSCRRVKPLGECCRTGLCPDQVETCQSEASNLGNFRPPWVVQLTTEVGGHKNTCTATIMDSSTLYTSSHCVTNASKILYPGTDWAIASFRANHPVGQISTVKLARPVSLLRTMHEINTPWSVSCPNNQDPKSRCLLFLSSYDPVANQSESVPAKQVDDKNCNITPIQIRSGFKCLEIKSYPKCPNLDGSSVAVKHGNGFYLIGILVDGPVDKDPQNCDINRSRYRKYRSLCQKLSGTHEFDDS